VSHPTSRIDKMVTTASAAILPDSIRWRAL
jgi:hypothetical protein